jgi:hypothetical protein
MLNPWKGITAAVSVTGVAAGLIALEIPDKAVRRWWALHAFTTDAIAGLVVLLITILVVDQVVRFHQIKNRSQATAASSHSDGSSHSLGKNGHRVPAEAGRVNAQQLAAAGTTPPKSPTPIC